MNARIAHISRITAGRRSAWIAWLIWSAIAIGAIAYCALRFTGPSPLQTNLLALLPATEADPVAEEALDRLADDLGNRVVFLVRDNDSARAKAAARRFGDSLRASGAFKSVVAELPPFDLSQIAHLYTPYRFGLLTDADRTALDKKSAALPAGLAERLYGPPDGGIATPLADDPFGWLQHWLNGLPLATSKLTIEEGLLVSHPVGSTAVLVVATLPGSAYESRIQRSVLDGVTHSEAELRRAYPEVGLARSGAVFYAESARSASEREVHRIGIVSLVGIALLMLWVFRSPNLIALGFLSTALGIVCALAATLLLFGKLHLITLVFGASLIGEAVDYSIQFFVVYRGARDEHEARSSVQKVFPALAVALTTSLLGYAILMVAPLPALKQIACFAIVGMATAFASVVSLLPTLLTAPPKVGSGMRYQRCAAMLGLWRRAFDGKRAIVFAIALLIVAAPGWSRLASNDDIHLLIDRDPALVVQEHVITRAVGIENSAEFFVIRGDSPESVLERTEALDARLARLAPDQRLEGWQSVTSFVPSAQRQNADRTLLATRVFGDVGALRKLMADAGFRDDVAPKWIRDFEGSQSTSLRIDEWLAAPWSQPFRHLWLGAARSVPGTYASIVIPQGVTAANRGALIEATRSVAGASFVDKAASVSTLFGACRVDSAIWLATALVLVVAVLMARYGMRGGALVALPVCLAIGATLAIFGYAHIPITLFNDLALMLVIGVGANYAVFLREGALRDDAELGAVWAGVMLSAATTLLSFGMLGLSSMPALASFGLTLSLGILVAVALAPIGIVAIQRSIV